MNMKNNIHFDLNCNLMIDSDKYIDIVRKGSTINNMHFKEIEVAGFQNGETTLQLNY